MAKETCQDCKRTVLMVPVGGELVAADPEIINVIPAVHVQGDGSGGVRMSARTTLARRLHAERCESYREADRKAALAAEMRAYNEKHGHPPRKPRRNQGL